MRRIWRVVLALGVVSGPVSMAAQPRGEPRAACATLVVDRALDGTPQARVVARRGCPAVGWTVRVVSDSAVPTRQPSGRHLTLRRVTVSVALRWPRPVHDGTRIRVAADSSEATRHGRPLPTPHRTALAEAARAPWPTWLEGAMLATTSPTGVTIEGAVAVPGDLRVERWTFPVRVELVERGVADTASAQLVPRGAEGAGEAWRHARWPVGAQPRTVQLRFPSRTPLAQQRRVLDRLEPAAVMWRAAEIVDVTLPSRVTADSLEDLLQRWRRWTAAPATIGIAPWALAPGGAPSPRCTADCIGGFVVRVAVRGASREEREATIRLMPGATAPAADSLADGVLRLFLRSVPDAASVMAMQRLPWIVRVATEVRGLSLADSALGARLGQRALAWLATAGWPRAEPPTVLAMEADGPWLAIAPGVDSAQRRRTLVVLGDGERIGLLGTDQGLHLDGAGAFEFANPDTAWFGTVFLDRARRLVPGVPALTMLVTALDHAIRDRRVPPPLRTLAVSPREAEAWTLDPRVRNYQPLPAADRSSTPARRATLEDAFARLDDGISTTIRREAVQQQAVHRLAALTWLPAVTYDMEREGRYALYALAERCRALVSDPTAPPWALAAVVHVLVSPAYRWQGDQCSRAIAPFAQPGVDSATIGGRLGIEAALDLLATHPRAADLSVLVPLAVADSTFDRRVRRLVADAGDRSLALGAIAQCRAGGDTLPADVRTAVFGAGHRALRRVLALFPLRCDPAAIAAAQRTAGRQGFVADGLASAPPR